MIMEDLFDGYQKLIHKREKLAFLYKGLSEANKSTCISNIINCLISLESNNINNDNIDSKENIVWFCKKYFSENMENRIWWLFTEGIIYLRLGKYNFDNCRKAQLLFEQFLEESKLKSKPSFYLFFMGHLTYEMGKINNSIKASEEMFRLSLECFNEIELNYKELGNYYMAIIYNMLGNVNMKLGKYSTSENYYIKAKELNEDFAFPYNGLGNIHRERGNYDKAIENYIVAANKDKDFTYPWNYLGDCFRHYEKYKIAYKCYQHAISISTGNNDIFPIYGLGRIYYELGNRNNNNEEYYKEAVKYFTAIKERFEECPPQIRFALKDLGQAKEKLGEYKAATEVYKEILNLGLFNKQMNYVELVKKSKESCEKSSDLANKCTHPSNEKGIKPLNHVMCQIFEQGIEKRVNDMKESFSVNFLRRKKLGIEKFNKIKKDCSNNRILSDYINMSERNGSTSFLHILRRWNSYTPIINNGRGGGYYLKINDIGIVIDPGFDFIKNFKEARHKFADIDIILISHSHDDHTSDLESILNLQHRYNELLKGNVLPRDLAKELRTTTKAVKDNKKLESIINERFSESRKRIMLYTSEGVLMKFSGMLEGKLSQVYENRYSDAKERDQGKDILIKTLKAGDIIYINDGLIVHAKKANHKDLIENQLCLGFAIELEDTVVIYTGDTGWYDKTNKEKLKEQYEGFKKDDKRIVLIAHLGGFKDVEEKYWNKQSSESDNSEIFYDNHLGRIGLAMLVEALNPDICIISEFGEEFDGVRIKIAEIYQKAFDLCGCYKTKFIPGDIGLFVNLEEKELNDGKIYNPTIRVINRIDFKNKTIKYDYVVPENVAFGECRDKNSLFYYNNKANIIESDCVQALLDGFTDDDEIDSSLLKLDF